MIELGCGDGAQIALINHPDYIGYDASPTALMLCRERFRGDSDKKFVSDPRGQQAELALSMDVLYHLDEADGSAHLADLFAAAKRFVLIFTTRDASADLPEHIRHREPPDGWFLKLDSPQPLNCAFFAYEIPC